MNAFQQRLGRCFLAVALSLNVECIHLIAQESPKLGTALPGTELLAVQEDIADQMLKGLDQFLLRQIDQARSQRSKQWQELTELIQQSDRERTQAWQTSYNAWIEQKRISLKECLGLRDERPPFSAIQILSSTEHSGTVARGAIVGGKSGPESKRTSEANAWQALLVRWPVMQGVFAEGLLIEPVGTSPCDSFVVIPDADQTPEQVAGLTDGLPVSLQTARLLASAGCRVLIPTLISRDVAARGPPGEPGRAELTNREFIYRPAFELGRHIIGYEVQKVLAAVDWFYSSSLRSHGGQGSQTEECSARTPPIIGVVGYGEGGLIALCCGALDDRIDQTFVKGSFGPRDGMWREPICRNLFGFLKQFSDAELASLVWPRTLVVDFAPGPSITIRTRGGAPGELMPLNINDATNEIRRAADILGITLDPCDVSARPPSAALLCGTTPLATARWLFAQSEPSEFESLTVDECTEENNMVPAPLNSLLHLPETLPGIEISDPLPDPVQRQNRQVAELIEHTQRLLAESSKHRDRFLKSLETSSLEIYRLSTDAHRRRFYEEVIGCFDEELLSFNAKSRQSWEAEKWTGYEVLLEVWPDVIAYGVLLLPKDIQANETRPVVVCQHGLEGRPTDLFLGDHPAYHDFASQLCERGYIVFAPQNPYLMEDRFRTLQRKANSIGRTLFSIIIPQHQQILRWLKSLPQVDGNRIGFYGLSYGGKSAMRIPAVLDDYCLSICSADFNEWIVKNASTNDGFSYVWTGEYEIFEYNLGNTFGYAEMASLICPRPFMVERGHFDTVAIDQWVGYEYAKVRNLYQARLGIGHLTEIEWFVGPHTINGKGTYQFLDRHLQK